MQIILVVCDKKGKNILFVLDNLQALTLKEAIKKTEKGEISGVHIVETQEGTYLRANPNAIEKDNLDAISIPLSGLTRFNMTEREAGAVSKYSLYRQQYLKKREAAGEKVVYVEGKRKSTEQEIIDYLSNYRKYIQDAAWDLRVDKYILGAILIDEALRRDLRDKLGDWLAILGRNTTVGVAQIEVETARDLIERNFYNPNPRDRKLAASKIAKTSRRHLYKYLRHPSHSIYFAAAKINQVKKDKAVEYDITKSEIIGDWYSGTGPLSRTKATKRGKQIATEFYKIAKKTLEK